MFLKATNKNLISYMFLIVFGVVIGSIVAGLDYIFGETLIKITEYRELHERWLIPFLAPAGLLIVYVYKKVGKKASRGMGLIFEIGTGHDDGIPKRLTPLIIFATWITHLFGGSAGREGVAVQIGGAVGNVFERNLEFLKIEDKKQIFLITGMAAGFAGLFETPFAALFFAIEVMVVGALQYQALIPALTAALVASQVSAYLKLEKFSFIIKPDITVDVVTILKLILIGVIFGIVGNIFTRALVYTKQKLATYFINPYLRVAVVGVILSILLLLLFEGRYAGLGTNLIHSSFYNEKILPYDWFLKLVLTILTLSAGFQGGEVTPLFAIGATLGVVLANIFGLPVGLIAALGYVAVFASATNTFLAPIFIGGEVFGFENIPYFLIVCAIAYSCNKNQSIYSGQKVITKK